MARPRKHQNDKDRRDAAREAKKRYEQKKKEGAAMRSKRISPRRDVQLIRDMPISPLWSIHFRKQYTAPPLPLDLLKEYSVDARWIRASFNGSDAFRKIYDREAGPVALMGWWLEYPPVGDSVFESVIEQYSLQDIPDYMDGWNIRFILDSFAEWWGGARCKGREQKTFLTDVASSMLSRMSMVLDELREIELWITNNADDSTRLRSKSIASRFRYWRYLELTLIRSELWWRCHRSIKQLYNEYKAEKMDWQTCWFENPLHDDVRTRITQTLKQGYITLEEGDCDDTSTNAQQIDAMDSCSSDEEPPGD